MMQAAPLSLQDSQAQHVAWRLLLTVHALACRRVDQALSDAGCLSFDDYDVLLTVSEAEDETMRMSELAEAVLLSNSGMSRRVARLVERGLLHREQSMADGRVFRVSLSDAGKRALDEAWEVYREALEEAFIQWVTRDEARRMGRIFQRVLDRIGTARHHGLLAAGLTDAPRRRA
jgi:DNA-binding MarR family transcriptional regulator